MLSVLRGAAVLLGIEKNSILAILIGAALVAFFVVVAFSKGVSNMGEIVHKVKSPDKAHAFYYYKKDTGLKLDTYIYFRRTGMFTYEPLFKCFDEPVPELEWTEKSIVFMGEKFAYSSYGE